MRAATGWVQDAQAQALRCATTELILTQACAPRIGGLPARGANARSILRCKQWLGCLCRPGCQLLVASVGGRSECASEAISALAFSPGHGTRPEVLW